MKIKKIILLLILIISLTKDAISQTDSVTISGNIDTALTNEFATSEIIMNMRNTANSYSQGVEMDVNITAEGYFKIKFKPEKRFTYLSFELQYKGINDDAKGIYANIGQSYRPWLAFQKEVYLFEQGDNINLTIDNKGHLFFKGKGSEKLNCQFQMYLIEPLSPSFVYRAIEYDNNGEMLKKLALQDSLLNLGIKLRLTILNTHKEQLTEAIYNMLYLDAIGSARYNTLSTLYLNCYTYPNDEMITTLQKYYQKYLNIAKLPSTDTISLAESAYYADMLFEKEFNYFRLTSQKKTYFKADSFKQIYEQIKQHYRGNLRDKLLYICFEKLSKFYSTESVEYIEEAKNIMNDGLYKKLLIKFKEKEENAFPFELEDSQSGHHKLSDFKGKVLVIDFWFTGCKACSDLNAAMPLVKTKFKNNNDVKFISICVDKDKKRWLNSLSTEKYTTMNELNLYTNGLGQQHPMIKFHNFTSFPRQLIIGKKGEIITSTPPIVSCTVTGFPIDSKTNEKDAIYNTNLFVKIIQDYLKKN